MADASVVVCAYTEDRWADIVVAIESLQSQTVTPSEIILVIDHNDRLFERAKSLQGVVTITNARVQGASGSRNSGVAVGSGSVVAFLDDDAIADPDWLEMLLRAYTQTNVAGVGNSIDPNWPADAPKWFPREFAWVVGCTYRGMPARTSPVRNLIGANMSVRRDVLEQVGVQKGSGTWRAQRTRVGPESREHPPARIRNSAFVSIKRIPTCAGSMSPVRMCDIAFLPIDVLGDTSFPDLAKKV